MSAKTETLKSIANKIRLKSLQMTTAAGSGHATSAMSAAEILSVLYMDQMYYDPDNPDSFEGDDFVISKGHGTPGLYAVMHEAGMLKKNDLQDYRTFGSILEGHPVPKIKGVRLATGSLGQGLSGGIGLAKAMKIDNINRHVHVLMGDGEMAEGSIWEAINLAPHLQVDNLIGIIDVNRLAQSGPAIYEWDTRAYEKRISVFGWHTEVIDGHDIEQIIQAIENAKNEKRPSMIIAKTVKGKGVSFLEDVEGRHGKPVTAEELQQAQKELEKTIKEVEITPSNQQKLSPKLKLKTVQVNIATDYSINDNVATRNAYGAALEKIMKQDTDVIVLDGDVKNSTRTKSIFSDYPDKAIECYIAEQNMIGIAAGLQARGKKPHAATFAAFMTRAHDQIRMAAYSYANIKLSGSHTGVSIGQDGPSQMGLEDMAMMRSIYNSIVLSPADAVSTEKLTARMHAREGISYIRTIRGATPVIYKNNEEFVIGGSKVLQTNETNQIAILATGITVSEALKASVILKEKGINSIIMDIYSIKPIDKDGILKATRNTRVVLTVEDHYPEGGLGEAVASSIGQERDVHVKGVDKLPHSGKPGELMADQGIDADGIVDHALQLIQK